MSRTAFFVLALLYPTTCLATPTAEFVAKWQVLKQNPSHLSPEEFANRPEMKAYMNEFMEAASAVKKQISERKSNNASPEICPPQEAHLDIGTVLADAGQLPATWQSRPFSESFAQVMKNRYPCPTTSPTR